MSEPANQQHTQNSTNTQEVQPPPDLRTGAAVGTATGAALGAAAAGGFGCNHEITWVHTHVCMCTAAHSFCAAAASTQPLRAGMPGMRIHPPPQLARINLPLLPCSHTRQMCRVVCNSSPCHCHTPSFPTTAANCTPQAWCQVALPLPLALLLAA